MAEIIDGGGSDSKGKHGKKKAKKGTAHIDMTPMVDLAFLLLTFFILTGSLHLRNNTSFGNYLYCL